MICLDIGTHISYIHFVEIVDMFFGLGNPAAFDYIIL